MWADPFSDPLTCIHCVPWSIGHSRYTASVCVTNLYPALVSLLSHHFSVSLTTVAMIQSRPTSAVGDGLPGYMVDIVLMPTSVLCWLAPRTSARGWKEWMADSCLGCRDSFGSRSKWLRLVNYYILATHNTEGSMDKKHTVKAMCLFACVCRYSSVWAGGWGWLVLYSRGTFCWSAHGPSVSSTVLVFSRNGTLNPRPSLCLWPHTACLPACVFESDF